MTTRSLVCFALFVQVSVVFFAGCGEKKDTQDSTPPVPGQMLTVNSAGSASAHLTWATATDDVSPGDALEYLAYHSLANDLNTVANVEANGTPVGTYAAGIEEADVTGLLPAVDYWFSVLVRDQAGNKAAYASVSAQTILECTVDLPPGGCPSPSPGMITACGRLADVESGELFEAAGATGAPCQGIAAADGPCSVTLQFFDAVDFAGNPSGAAPIVPETMYVDDCGRYRAENMTPPSLGFLSLTVDDAAGTLDRHRLTGVQALSGDPEAIRALRAFVTRSTTDTAWSTAAGLVGPTFADLGVFAAVFRHQGIGRSGVTLTRSGAGAPGDDYYFSDLGQTRSAVVAAGPTGNNGSALLLNSSLVEHSGTGNEPIGCMWPSILGASISGVVLVQPMNAVTTTGAVCP